MTFEILTGITKPPYHKFVFPDHINENNINSILLILACS